MTEYAIQHVVMVRMNTMDEFPAQTRAKKSVSQLVKQLKKTPKLLYEGGKHEIPTSRPQSERKQN